MPVGIERINNPNADPNPNITFISAQEGKKDSDKALKILQAVAAQVRPIMKARGFGVNSLREHEWNSVFSGRNWNGGEIIELVLRRKDGSFAPYKYILFVMCHELAHIEQMNHSHAFQKVNKGIRSELSALRAKSYYGDGFYSAGRNLTLGINEPEFHAEDFPVYTCGGANKRKTTYRKASGSASSGKARAGSAKSGRTGRQTAVGRVPGSRVKSGEAFSGDGHVLDETAENSFFRKQATSKTAINARATAAEARAAAAKKDKRKEEKKRWNAQKEDMIEIIDSDDEPVEIDDDSDGSDSDVEIIEQILDEFDLARGVEYDEDEADYWKGAAEDYLDNDEDIVEVKGGIVQTGGSGSASGSRPRGYRSDSNNATSSNSKGKKRAISAAIESESDLDVPTLKKKSNKSSTRNERRITSDLESTDDGSKKKSKSKVIPTTSGDSSKGRTRRADSEERVSSAAKSKQRAPMNPFKTNSELQARFEEDNKSSRRRAQQDSSSSSPPSPPPSPPRSATQAGKKKIFCLRFLLFNAASTEKEV